MTMSVATLEILEQGQFTSAQARALTKALELESATRRDDIATKSDMLELRHILEIKMEAQKAELVRWVFTVGAGQLAVVLGAVYFMCAQLKG